MIQSFPASIHIPKSSSGIGSQPDIRRFLRREAQFHLQEVGAAGNRFIVGWGNRRSGDRAVALAARLQSTGLRLEDGFLSAMLPNTRRFSLVLDDLGIYYDASRESRLERLIRAPISEIDRNRAAALRTRWVEVGASKTNVAPEYSGPLPDEYVLVADQVRNDASIPGGLACTTSFDIMLDAAIRENPGKSIVVKAHPASLARRAGTYFDAGRLAQDSRILLITDACRPNRLIAGAQKVYTVTSQIGFEALLHGVPVRTFGMPFYAGWGLTEDEIPAPERRRPVELETLIHAALVRYPLYLDPETDAVSTPEACLDLVAAHRALTDRIPGRLHTVGLSSRKRKRLARLLPGVDLAARSPSATLAWGACPVPARPGRQTVLRIEDGFLRSVGLGAGFADPVSWIFDAHGVHFDPARPCGLDRILDDAPFTQEERDRAEGLRRAIVAARVTKYNLGGTQWRRPETSRPVLLVAGQVESDASIRLGCRDIATDMDLLACVRAEAPDAWIVYKPHPDVVHGFRAGNADRDRAADLADEIVPHADMASLLERVDRVHVMTSLTGFEAILRGTPVTCHGLPFYAGRGLTDDRLAVPHWRKPVDPEDFMVACLLRYPAYMHPVTGLATTPERALAWLERNSRPEGHAQHRPAPLSRILSRIAEMRRMSQGALRLR